MVAASLWHFVTMIAISWFTATKWLYNFAIVCIIKCYSLLNFTSVYVAPNLCNWHTCHQLRNFWNHCHLCFDCALPENIALSGTPWDQLVSAPWWYYSEHHTYVLQVIAIPLCWKSLNRNDLHEACNVIELNHGTNALDKRHSHKCCTQLVK